MIVLAAPLLFMLECVFGAPLRMLCSGHRHGVVVSSTRLDVRLIHFLCVLVRGVGELARLCSFIAIISRRFDGLCRVAWSSPLEAFRWVVVTRLYCCMIHFVFGTFVRSAVWSVCHPSRVPRLPPPQQVRHRAPVRGRQLLLGVGGDRHPLRARDAAAGSADPPRLVYEPACAFRR